MSREKKTRPSKSEIEFYEDWLHRSSEVESRTSIPNDAPWHSRSALRELVRFAVRKQHCDGSVEIKLLTSSLTPYVYDSEWTSFVEQFVRSGGKLKVLIWNEEIPDGAKTLQDINPETVEVRCSYTNYLGDKLNHFILVGDRAFRKEAPHKSFEASEFSDLSPKISAQICFNDPKDAKELIQFFDKLWDTCARQSSSLSLSDGQ